MKVHFWCGLHMSKAGLLIEQTLFIRVDEVESIDLLGVLLRTDGFWICLLIILLKSFELNAGI
ncbi:hypothetical protein DAHU10_019190 [Hanseniaspora uvarum]|nr:hypothetical protein DAHU10_019190 [Hanseniaspora uvarum]